MMAGVANTVMWEGIPRGAVDDRSAGKVVERLAERG